jgi:hypothetical protein
MRDIDIAKNVALRFAAEQESCEIRYKLPGKGGLKSKAFKDEKAALAWIDKQPADIEVQWPSSRKTASEQSAQADFAETLKKYLSVGDRIVRIKEYAPGSGDRLGSVYVNYVNLPQGVGSAGGGAEAENNRTSFWIRWNEDGKVKIEMSNSVLPRSSRLRAKTGTPDQVAKYLADFLNKVAKEVEPNFTHSKP